MIDDPDCPVCDGHDWKIVARRVFKAADGPRRAAYVALRYRVLFELWRPGAAELELTLQYCGGCGLLIYTPRPTQDELAAKYRFSTFKMVTALAALEAGAITPETTVRCPGYLEFGNRRFHCWKRGGHGGVNLERSLMESCDVYYYDIAQRVGIDKIAEMGRRLGLGHKFDIPMSAVTDGIMPDKAWMLERYKQEWRIGDTINASIGQGYVLASRLQLAVMTARVASGRAVTPRLIRMVNDKEMPVVEAPPVPDSGQGCFIQGFMPRTLTHLDRNGNALRGHPNI